MEKKKKGRGQRVAEGVIAIRTVSKVMGHEVISQSVNQIVGYKLLMKSN